MMRLKASIGGVVIGMLANALRAACTWDQPPASMNFGPYSVFGGPLAANSLFQVSCKPKETGVIRLSRGGASSFNPRTLFQGVSATLPYNLYLETTQTTIWGDGTGGTQFATVLGDNSTTTYVGRIYAGLPGGADVPAGTYTDTIQATLEKSGGGGLTSVYFTVTTIVLPECQVSATPLNFGAYDPVGGAPCTTTGIVNVYCTRGTPATVSLDGGQNQIPGGTRQMIFGISDFLEYQIFRDSTLTTVWNTANTNNGTSSSKMTPVNNGFIAYGWIRGGQDAKFGAYNDLVRVTVDY